MNGPRAIAVREVTVPRTDRGTGKPKPLFLATWTDALFLHFEVDPRPLQACSPFELDLWQGRAFVSLVAFTMRDMRLAGGGAWGAWLCRPIATHPFLNLRTYVRWGRKSAICFLAEWLPNWISLLCGPGLYSLPYRHARIRYLRQGRDLSGSVSTRIGFFAYRGSLSGESFVPSEPGSVDEFLLERYAACNAGDLLVASASATRVFEVCHTPWLQVKTAIEITDDSLLRNAAAWWPDAQFVGANFSPGVSDVGMSAPRRWIIPP